MRYRQRHINFYVGPMVHELLFEGDRLLHEVDRGPFRSVQALYNVILDLTERHVSDPRHRARHAMEDIRSGESELDEDPLNAAMTGGTHSSRPDTLEAVLVRADAEDQENERECGMSKNKLSWLSRDLQKYRIMLPQLFTLLPAVEPLTTTLTHPDLLQANIFVDKTLIDWERARLEPTGLMGFIPKFLEDGETDTFYVPSRSSAPEVVESLQVYDYDMLAEAKGMYESTYQLITGKIQSTMLRTVYRDELIRLKSPLCKAFDRDPESLEQQLMGRIYWPENPANTSGWQIFGRSHL